LWLWPRLPLWLTPWMGYMPIREAATRAYERTPPSPVAQKISRMATTPEEVLVTFAELIRDTGIPLYGKRLPSRRFEVIPRDQYYRLQFTQGASGLKPIGAADSVVYADVSIGRRDLEAIRAIEKEARVAPSARRRLGYAHTPLPVCYCRPCSSQTNNWPSSSLGRSGSRRFELSLQLVIEQGHCAS
jgi:hypothetical protein